MYFTFLGYDVVFSRELVPSIEGFSLDKRGDYWIFEEKLGGNPFGTLGQDKSDLGKGSHSRNV